MKCETCIVLLVSREDLASQTMATIKNDNGPKFVYSPNREEHRKRRRGRDRRGKERDKRVCPLKLYSVRFLGLIINK